MNWLVLLHTFSGKHSANDRVSAWRALRRIGAVALASGAQILPERADCRVALRQIADTVRLAGGESVLLNVAQIEGQSDPELIARFHAERADASVALLAEIRAQQPDTATRGWLQRFERRVDALATADYFGAPALTTLRQALREAHLRVAPSVPKFRQVGAALAAYRGRVWVTAASPSIDGLACTWLIKRFIDRNAHVNFNGHVRTGDVAFDMSDGEFTHHAGHCALERMIFAFHLDAPALTMIGDIVHDLVMSDRPIKHPETAGIAAAVRGWRASGALSANELEGRSRGLFDGLYADFAMRGHA
jgi:hypothetical protein